MMLWRYGRRGILFVAPGLVRFHSDPDAPPATALQRAAGDELEPLGFRRLGARSEEGPLGGLGLRSDAWVDEAAGAYADVFEEAPRKGAGARLYFLSVFPDAAVALTANHARKGRSGGTAEVGGIPGAGVAATWAAHRRVLDRMAPRHGAPGARADLGAREAAARAFYRAAGAREFRARLPRLFPQYPSRGLDPGLGSAHTSPLEPASDGGVTDESRQPRRRRLPRREAHALRDLRGSPEGPLRDRPRGARLQGGARTVRRRARGRGPRRVRQRHPDLRRRHLPREARGAPGRGARRTSPPSS